MKPTETLVHLITFAWLLAVSTVCLIRIDCQVGDADACKIIVLRLLDLNSNASITRWLFKYLVPLHLGHVFLNL